MFRPAQVPRAPHAYPSPPCVPIEPNVSTQSTPCVPRVPHVRPYHPMRVPRVPHARIRACDTKRPPLVHAAYCCDDATGQPSAPLQPPHHSNHRTSATAAPQQQQSTVAQHRADQSSAVQHMPSHIGAQLDAATHRPAQRQRQRQPPAAAMRAMRPDRESSVNRHDVRTHDHRTVWTARYICSRQRAPSSGVRAGHARAHARAWREGMR